MSRDDGFVIADVATGLLDDAKVRHLWRELGPDQGQMGHALALHMATLLASWREGCRVPVGEAAPVWLVVDEALVETLIRVRLLDRTRRLSVRSWNAWFGPALARKRARQEAGRTGGIASGKVRGSKAEATVKQPSSNRSEATVKQPFAKSNPSVPSDRTVRPARGRAGGDDKASPTKTTNGRLLEALDPETARKLGLVPAGGNLATGSEELHHQGKPPEPMAPNAESPADAPAESWFEPGGAI